MLICTASPANEHKDMTTSTMNFGGTAKAVVNDAKVNEQPAVDADGNVMLIRQIAEMEAKLGDMDAHEKKVQKERDQLKKDNDILKKCLIDYQSREEEWDETRKALDKLNNKFVPENKDDEEKDKDKEDKDSWMDFDLKLKLTSESTLLAL